MSDKAILGVIKYSKLTSEEVDANSWALKWRRAKTHFKTPHSSTHLERINYSNYNRNNNSNDSRGLWILTFRLTSSGITMENFVKFWSIPNLRQVHRMTTSHIDHYEGRDTPYMLYQWPRVQNVNPFHSMVITVSSYIPIFDTSAKNHHIITLNTKRSKVPCIM